MTPSSSTADPDGAPYAALVENGGLRRLDLSLSISHTGQLAFCALCDQPGLAVGADVERVEAREPSFAKTFFSASEEDALRNAPAEARDLLTTAIWSGKEAVLKALRTGLRADTRRVQCCVRRSEHLFTAWEPMAITLDAPLALPGPFSLAGWWRAIDGGHEGAAMNGAASGCMCWCWPCSAFRRRRLCPRAPLSTHNLLSV